MSKSSARPFRLNLFDCMILLLLVFAILLFLWFTLFSEETKAQRAMASLYITVEVKNLPQACLSSLAEGQTVYDRNTGEILGTIETVEVTPAPYWDGTQTDMVNGQLFAKEYDHPDLRTLRLTILTTANPNTQTPKVAGETRMVGKQISFHTATFLATGYCTSLDFSFT